MPHGSHFLLAPIGSIGDVHPFLGIGRSLRARGHDVTVVTAGPFRAAVESAGCRFVEVLNEDAFQRTTENPDLWHPRRGLALVLETTARHLRDAWRAFESVYEPGRTVLVGHTLGFALRVFEEKHGAPGATLHLAPNVFRSDYRQPVLPPSVDLTRLPAWTKRTLWWATDRLMIDPHIAPALNAWRAELGLPPVSRIFSRWLHSPQRVIGLFPAWFGDPQPDWPPQLRLTGFPLFDEADTHGFDADLETFLADGDPPIAFTPGSANRHAGAFFEAAVAATTRLGRRALLLTRYADQVPADLPSGIIHVPYAPFSTLLPRCGALVHHGGIGTCAQGMAAGVPQLVMPLGFDQPDNGARVARLGMGAVIARRRFTGPGVAAALGPLLSSALVADACRRHRALIAAARPIEETCDLLEALRSHVESAPAA